MLCVYNIINDLYDLIVTYLINTMVMILELAHTLKIVALNGQIKNHDCIRILYTISVL